MPFPASEMVRCKCERCGFDGHHIADMPHVCRTFVSLDEYEALKRDAGRYRRLKSFALPRYIVLVRSGESASLYKESEITVWLASWESLDSHLDSPEPSHSGDEQ